MADKEEFVVPHLSLIEVPGSQVSVEERITLQGASMQWSQLFKLAVWSSQEGVEDLNAYILFEVWCHSHHLMIMRVHFMSAAMPRGGVYKFVDEVAEKSQCCTSSWHRYHNLTVADRTTG